MKPRQTRRPGALALLVLLPLPYGCAVQAQETRGDATTGEALFSQFACYSCHGYNGTGRRPLSIATSGILSSESVFLSYLRLRGDQNPINPKNSMPHYAQESLSDAQARDLYAYLLTLDDSPPPLEEIAVMQDILEDAERRADNDPDE